MDGRQQNQCEEFRLTIGEAVRARRKTLGTHYLASSMYNEAQADVNKARVEFRKARHKWENQYWDVVIKEAQEAAEQKRIGNMYKTLKTIRQRDSKGTAPSETFTAEEFKIHFEKVGANRHEQEHDKSSTGFLTEVMTLSLVKPENG